MPSPRNGFRVALSSVWNWVVTLGGAGLVTTITSIFSEASAVQLAGVAASCVVFIVGAYGLYREHHPQERDERLRDLHKEKIARWRSFVEEWQRGGGEIGDEEVWYRETNEFSEITALMNETERMALEEDRGRRGTLSVVRDTLNRLEQEWNLV